MATATSRLVNYSTGLAEGRLKCKPFGSVGPLGNCEERDNVACSVLVRVIEVMTCAKGCRTGITARHYHRSGC